MIQYIRSGQNKTRRTEEADPWKMSLNRPTFKVLCQLYNMLKGWRKKNQGQLPNAPDLFLKTHFKELPGKGQVASNTKAKRIAETYQKKLEEARSQGIQKIPNELYWEMVGGRNKKGRVKGLGQSAELYYGKRMGRVSRSLQQYTPSIISQMQDQMEHRVQALQTQIEVEMQSRIDSRMAEIDRRYKESMDEMMIVSQTTTHVPPFILSIKTLETTRVVMEQARVPR